jgi:long-chain acyl-CoA synthetase
VPVAFVVRTTVDLSEDDVKRWALEHGPAAQHPRAVWFLDELPLSGTEKVDRTGLVEEAGRRRL